MNRCSSVCIVTGYWLDVQGSISVRDSSLRHHVQTVSGVHMTTYPIGSWGFYSE